MAKPELSYGEPNDVESTSKNCESLITSKQQKMKINHEKKKEVEGEARNSENSKMKLVSHMVICCTAKKQDKERLET